MANANTPYYPRLMATLFSQYVDKHKDFTFDFNSGNLHDIPLSSQLTKLKQSLSSIFHRHGAVELATPLLHPKVLSKIMIDFSSFRNDSSVVG